MNNFRVYVELQKESLFNEWIDELLKLNSFYGDENFAVGIWNIAKDYAYNIATSVDPLGMFKICHSEIKIKYHSFCSNFYETCLACVFTMIYKRVDKAFINQIIDYIPENVCFPASLENKFFSVLEKIKKGELKDDYDYTKKKDSQNADANKGVTADNGKMQELEKRIQELEKSKEELEKSKEELEEELAEYKKGPIVDNPHNKVVLELFAKLLEESGADLNKRGNKANAARLAKTITRLPLSTCQNYFSDRLRTTVHSDEVLKMNTAIKELGIEWQL